MKPAHFSISIVRVAERFTEEVTVICDRCGRDITQAVNPPLLVMRVPGLAEMAAMDMHSSVVAFRDRLREQVREAREHGHPILVDAEMELTQLRGGDLLESLVRHARVCES